MEGGGKERKIRNSSMTKWDTVHCEILKFLRKLWQLFRSNLEERGTIWEYWKEAEEFLCLKKRIQY